VRAAKRNPRSLHDRVRYALIRARQNGYNFSGWTDRDIAVDLHQGSPDFSDVTEYDIQIAVAACRAGTAVKPST
jgi:hypothetical protein